MKCRPQLGGDQHPRHVHGRPDMLTDRQGESWLLSVLVVSVACQGSACLSLSICEAQSQSDASLSSRLGFELEGANAN